MMLPAISSERARALVSRFRDMRPLVVGDVMLDRFIVGTVTRISPEAPVPVVRFRSEYVRLGGAANVANNLAALGAQLTLVGVVGRDDAAHRVREALIAARIDPRGLVEDEGRPTVEKVRVVTERNQQVARIDYEDDTDVSGTPEQALVDRIGQCRGVADVVIVSDYLKGAITHGVMKALVSGDERPPVLVDPKIPHLDRYAGATLVTPNSLEAEIATHRLIRSDDDARDAALDFRSRAQCSAVLITRGEHGMWLSCEGAEGAVSPMAREVADVTGAGDTVAATVALTLAAGGTLAEAAVLANYAAGVVVGKFGPATLTADELLDQLALNK
jgi:D-beta-D-heptose 7-phosphate kinase/D-beta-D-heptose 1-phosphate adenosyltransferase